MKKTFQIVINVIVLLLTSENKQCNLIDFFHSLHVCAEVQHAVCVVHNVPHVETVPVLALCTL